MSSKEKEVIVYKDGGSGFLDIKRDDGIIPVRDPETNTLDWRYSKCKDAGVKEARNKDLPLTIVNRTLGDSVCIVRALSGASGK